MNNEAVHLTPEHYIFGMQGTKWQDTEAVKELCMAHKPICTFCQSFCLVDKRRVDVFY
jgi:hypothetical protein